MQRPLLSRGYLPRELPPPFYSESLGMAFGAAPLPPDITGPNPALAGPVRHNLPRAGLMRRPLSIPDPIRYLLLVHDIAAGWGQIQSLMNRAQLSVSRPRRDHRGHRAFTFRIPYSRHDIFRARIRAGARYIVQADINQFYPSLYTHAIPWAVHGKAFAKANRGLGHLGNLLDKRVRDGQHGQTMGIPIGPDTSFLLAEALLGSFDADVAARLRGRPVMRFMDEYEIAYRSFTEAEEGIAILQDVLADYEFHLNPKKSMICECPVPLQPPWLVALQTVPLAAQGRAARKHVMAFIDKAFELVHKLPGEPIVNWAIPRLMSIDFNTDQWQLVQPLILQAAAAEPGCLSRCLRLILKAQMGTLPIDQNLLSDTLNVALLNSINRGHGSEAAWAVWGFILFGIPIDATVVAPLQEMDDDIVALVSLDAMARGLIPSGPAFATWTAKLTASGLQDGHWLLAYEATVKNWLSSAGPNPVQRNRAYRHLARNNVEFYNAGNPQALTLAHEHSAPSWMVLVRDYLQ